MISTSIHDVKKIWVTKSRRVWPKKSKIKSWVRDIRIQFGDDDSVNERVEITLYATSKGKIEIKRGEEI